MSPRRDKVAEELLELALYDSGIIPLLLLSHARSLQIRVRAYLERTRKPPASKETEEALNRLTEGASTGGHLEESLRSFLQAAQKAAASYVIARDTRREEELASDILELLASHALLSQVPFSALLPDRKRALIESGLSPIELSKRLAGELAKGALSSRSLWRENKGKATIAPPEEGTVSVETGAAPYDIEPGDTVQIDGSTIELRYTREAEIVGEVPYTAPSQPVPLFVEAERGKEGELSASLLDTRTVSVGQQLPETIGSFLYLQYAGDRTALSQLDRDRVSAIEGLSYLIVGVRPGGKLLVDPPLPSTVSGSWKCTISSLRLPLYLPATLQLSRAPIKPGYTLTGTATGVLLPGEVAKKPTGEEFVVLRHTSSTLEVYPTALSLSAGDTLTGQESGMQFTVSSASLNTRELQLEGGALLKDETSTYLVLRSQPVGGSYASLSGTTLTLSLSSGERGFAELGVCPGDVVVLGGQEFTISAITSNTKATLSSSGSYTGAWTLRGRPLALSATDEGPLLKAEKQDVSTQISGGIYDSSSYTERTVFSPSRRSSDLSSLGISFPYADREGPVPAHLLAKELPYAQLEGDRIALSKKGTLVFGSGSGHPKIGLPENEERRPGYSKVRILSSEEPIRPGDLLVFSGQEVRVRAVRGEYAHLESAIALNGKVEVAVRCGKAQAWVSFVRLLEGLRGIELLEKFASLELPLLDSLEEGEELADLGSLTPGQLLEALRAGSLELLVHSQRDAIELESASLLSLYQQEIIDGGEKPE